ncbi:hypothetical protein HMPREF0973_00669 [Prevotella veroralis F0319]|uniref:Uncharacterized protein n=1 Tax=Prevotella veroralis F0319 TaxID=649761 RepID=C9MM40_9BACT|nr:hypothetical protein HMPREF0973_00669 [Prevotella veroralis F0319]
MIKDAEVGTIKSHLHDDRRKALYLLYKAFQTAKSQNNTQTYCVFIVFLQCLRTQR